MALLDHKGQPLRKKKLGRNDPCPCGSGKKYKKCCAKPQRMHNPARRKDGERTPHVPPRVAGAVVSTVPDAPAAMRDVAAEAMAGVGLPPRFAHAYKKTGVWISAAARCLHTEDELKGWDEALEEYDAECARGESPGDDAGVQAAGADATGDPGPGDEEAPGAAAG